MSSKYLTKEWKKSILHDANKCTKGIRKTRIDVIDVTFFLLFYSY